MKDILDDHKTDHAQHDTLGYGEDSKEDKVDGECPENMQIFVSHRNGWQHYWLLIVMALCNFSIFSLGPFSIWNSGGH